MRIIEIINLALQYNELLVNFHKASVWLDSKRVSMDNKQKFFPKWYGLLSQMDKILKQFESIGITFADCESIELIELPEELKRKEVESFIEDVLSKYKIQKSVT